MKNTKTEKDIERQISYRPKGIMINSFRIEIPTNSEFDVFNASLRFQCHWKIQEEESSLLFAIKFQAWPVGNDEEEVCSGSVVFAYHIVDLSVLPQKEGQYACPTRFLMQIASMSYSTLRGIIHERVVGTVAQGLIIPPMKPADLLNIKGEDRSSSKSVAEVD